MGSYHERVLYEAYSRTRVLINRLTHEFWADPAAIGALRILGIQREDLPLQDVRRVFDIVLSNAAAKIRAADGYLEPDKSSLLAAIATLYGAQYPELIGTLGAIGPDGVREYVHPEAVPTAEQRLLIGRSHERIDATLAHERQLQETACHICGGIGALLGFLAGITGALIWLLWH